MSSSHDEAEELAPPLENSSFGLLDLFLGTTIRTPQVAWDFLTVYELINLACVSKAYREKLQRGFEYSYCRDGRDYIVPYPGFPGLLRHTDTLQNAVQDESNGNAIAYNEHNRAGLYPHQLASLKAMHQMENSNTAFGSLRGGVLGDAPGLGKTVSTLALISSTAGKRPVNPPEFWESAGDAEWVAYACNPMAREEILKCIQPVRNYMTKPELVDVSPPFQKNRFPTMKSFEVYLKRILRGDRNYPRVTLSQWELVRQKLLDLRIGMDSRNRRLMYSETGRRLLMERRLIRSSATLLVVPDALYEHWFQQIQNHLYLPLFADHYSVRNESHGSKNIARGVVYLDGLGDLADVTKGEKTLENTRNLHQRVLSAQELSGYLIVIVTFSRCRNEVRLGHADSNAETTKQKKNRNTNGDTKKRNKRRRNCAPTLPQSNELLSIHRSPLLKLRWLRLMIDEGHQKEEDQDLDKFIDQVAAERRWVISGTPLTGNEDDANYINDALDQLQRILEFLRHPKYGISKSSKQAWETEVKEPFVSKKSRTKLLDVLKEIMVMHRKQDLKLPKPKFLQIEREVDIPKEVEAQITTTATNYGSVQNPYGMFPYKLDSYLHSPEFQSLVDDAQAKYIVESMRTARENRSVLCRSTNAQSNLDRRPIKGVVYSSSNKDLLSVSDSILRKIQQENVAELYHNSKIGDMSAELERFRHGSKMYRENATINTSCDRYLMEVVSIQLGRRYLIEPERILRTNNVPLVRLGGEPMKHYSLNSKFWRVNDELVVDIRQAHPLLPERKPLSVWVEWGVNKCFALAQEDNFEGRDWFFGPLPDYFDLTSNGPIEMEFLLKKWQHCGEYHRSRWYRGPKLLDTPILKRKDDVYLMCLDAKLAHGLDLSFVTHIFLLEPINDAALLEQVTARAHRLGATGPVTIETIHVFYKCSDGFQQKVLMGKAANDAAESKLKRKHNQHQGLASHQNRKALLNTVVCSHCYRPFDSKDLAEQHERTLCPQNPDNHVQPNTYHLSSVYREIRPPLPMVSSSLDSEGLES